MNEKHWKLKGSQKKLVPVYGVLFALLALCPSLAADIYFFTHTTAFETGKVLKLIWFCLLCDIVIWGFAATIILIGSVLVFAVFQIIQSIRK